MKNALLTMMLASLPVLGAGEKPRAMFGVVTENVPLSQGGVLVRAVRPGSPAEAVKLQPGDRIEQLDGVRVNSREDMRRVLSALQPGSTMEIVYYPAGSLQTSRISAVLAERPQRATSPVADSPGAAVGGDRRMRPLVVSPTIRSAMREHRKAVAAQLAALPEGFVPAEVSDSLQAIRHLARDANPQGRGWMPGEAGEVTLQFRDGQGVLVLHGASNQLTLSVYDAAGKQVCVLPLNTPEERAAVPPAVIERLKRLR